MKAELRLSVLAILIAMVIAACGSGGGGGGSASSGVATGSFPAFITVDPSGKFAYTANWGSGNISVYSINTTTGALQ